MDLIMIEYYHDKGFMPDRIYYQQNNKSAAYNLQEQRRKLIAAANESENAAILEKHIEKILDSKIEKAFDDVFKSFK